MLYNQSQADPVQLSEDEYSKGLFKIRLGRLTKHLSWPNNALEPTQYILRDGVSSRPLKFSTISDIKDATPNGCQSKQCTYRILSAIPHGVNNPANTEPNVG